MARAGSVTISVKIRGAREIVRAIGRLGKDANREIRDKTLAISKDFATWAQADARAEGRQAAILAPTVRARRDRVPAATVGGRRKVGRRRAPAGALVFGSIFGASAYRQFRPHRGQNSYWFFQTAEERQPEIERRWLEAADEVIRGFLRG